MGQRPSFEEPRHLEEIGLDADRIAHDPLARTSPLHLRRHDGEDLVDGADGVERRADEAEPDHVHVRVAVDEARQDGAASQRDLASAGAGEAADLVGAAHRGDAAAANGQRLDDSIAGVDGVDAPAVQDQVGGRVCRHLTRLSYQPRAH